MWLAWSALFSTTIRVITVVKIQWNPALVNSRYNEDPVITNNTDGNKPRYNKIPSITNRFWRSQRTTYPALTNILSCRSQSVTTI